MGDDTPVIVHHPSQVDFAKPGKQHYRVAFHLDSSWGHSLLPLTVINGRRLLPGGATPRRLAVFGGTHGNEWEGQIVVKRLAQELNPEEVSGKIVLVPQLSPSACAANQRVSPLDNVNMNRAFPGNPRGTISYRIAHFVKSHIFPEVDVIFDLHAGGREGGFALCTSFHSVPDAMRFQETVKVASLFDTPFTLIYSSEMASGLLTDEAEAEGKVAIGGEFGHGEGVDRRGTLHGYEGILNVLRHYGMIDGKVRKIDLDRQSPPRLVEARNLEDYVPCPSTGIWEPLIDLGTEIRKGQLVGRLHDFSNYTAATLEVSAHQDGVVIMMCGTAVCREGTTLYVIAKDAPGVTKATVS